MGSRPSYIVTHHAIQRARERMVCPRCPGARCECSQRLVAARVRRVVAEGETTSKRTVRDMVPDLRGSARPDSGRFVVHPSGVAIVVGRRVVTVLDPGCDPADWISSLLVQAVFGMWVPTCRTLPSQWRARRRVAKLAKGA